MLATEWLNGSKGKSYIVNATPAVISNKTQAIKRHIIKKKDVKITSWIVQYIAKLVVWIKRLFFLRTSLPILPFPLDHEQDL